MRLFALALLLAVSGCAYFEERTDAMAKCGNDQSCIERVIGAGKAGKAVGDATGIPWAGAAAGGLTAFLVLFFARKKKDE
jgi:hypothetical protein